MSELKERKQAFYRTLVQHGIQNPMNLKEALPLGSDVPQDRLENWLWRFGRVRKMEFPEQIRNVNRFKLGADPEFIFVQPQAEYEERARVDAARLGMRQGLAFGADNNGRLVEIRPFPSRSALETCASVLATLKWLAVVLPKTLQYRWMAGAFLFSDGLGGHVHFGRKRPDRTMEIRALDKMNELLTALNLYPIGEIVARRRGDAHNQRYGMPGDFRLQQHGYEYRTFPSWLDSPALAFITLTASKLTVQDPRLVLNMVVTNNNSTRFHQLMNLFRFYKGVDDDARLAYLVCDRGTPRHVGGDFKGRWGIPIEETGITPPEVVPSAIKPHENELRAVFEKLRHGKDIAWTPPVATWEPVNLPPGYVPCIQYTETHGVKGIGELVCRMCCHVNHKVVFVQGRESDPPTLLFAGKEYTHRWPSDWRQKYPEIHEYDERGYVLVPQNVREGQDGRRAKELLLSGLFPIWDVRTVQADSYDKWVESFARKEKQAKYAGTVVLDALVKNRKSSGWGMPYLKESEEEF